MKKFLILMGVVYLPSGVCAEPSKHDKTETYQGEEMVIFSANSNRKFPDTAKSTPSYTIDKIDVQTRVNATTVEDVVRYSPGVLIRKRFIGDPNGTLGIRTSGQTHELTSRGKDLQAEVIAKAGAEAFFPDTDFGRLLLEKIERKLAQQRKVFGAIASADTALIFVEGHINYPVAAILDRPMRAGCLTQPSGFSRRRADEVSLLYRNRLAHQPFPFDHHKTFQSEPAARIRQGVQTLAGPAAPGFDAPMAGIDGFCEAVAKAFELTLAGGAEEIAHCLV